jgi:transcriptional regulator with XRE-family HTH domain
MSLTPAQCKAARALLGWTQLDLAKFASVSADAIRYFETEKRTPRPASLEQINIAFADAAVTFIDDNGEDAGVMTNGASSSSQIRAARALLGWSHADLAQASGVSGATVMRLETEQSVPRRASVKVIVRALNAAGVIFVEDDRGVAGVRLRESA